MSFQEDSKIEKNNLQAILFETKNWNEIKARTWLHKHDLKPIKEVHKTVKYYRYRLRNPDDFTSFRIIHLGDNIDAIYGLK